MGLLNKDKEPNGNWIHDHLLSITLFSFFLISWVGQAIFQFQHHVDQSATHGESLPSFWSGDYWAAFLATSAENWQSEFLQLFSMVVLTTYLIHRDSPQSREGTDRMESKIDKILEKVDS